MSESVIAEAGTEALPARVTAPEPSTRATRTEACRIYRNGFVLDEQELRRLYDCLQQHMLRLDKNQLLCGSFEVRFRNGVITQNLCLDDVLSLENFGSCAVSRLRLEMRPTFGASDKQRIFVEFSNADEDPDSWISIKYTIVGERDWVFVCSSELEERIAKLKRFAPNQIAHRLMMPLLALCMLLCMGVPPLINVRHGPRPYETLEALWKSGNIKGPVEAIIELEKLKTTDMPFWPPFIGAGLFFAVLGVCGLAFWPVYNFCWGDYLRQYQRRQAVKRYLFVVILTGLIVSIAAGVVTNKLPWLR